MIDDHDELTAALRRDLAAAAIAHDDDRAAAMIASATAGTPLAVRNWQAPVAAAAAVVVVGGGAALVAATQGDGGTATGGGTARCPTSAPAVASAPFATSSAAAAPSSAPAGPNLPGEIGPPASFAPVQTAPTASAGPSVGYGDRCRTPPVADTTPARSHALPTSVEYTVTAEPGTTTTHTTQIPGWSGLSTVEVHRNSGDGGTLSAGSDASSVAFTVNLAMMTGKRTTAIEYLTLSVEHSAQVGLTCAGTTVCSMHVTFGRALSVARPGVTATRTR